ncbi:MAG: transcriptional regulator, AsnC family [Verrucomicrobiales bacterium]|nr:transcriptional regulator, AsnC family [Verrucomicrobiales bacterium]
MDALLDLLTKDSRLSVEDLAARLNLTAAEVQAKVAAWEADGTILGYQAVIDPEKTHSSGVTALIEVRLTPERGGGFDRLAERVAKFDQVKTCWLMSGGFDLAVVVEAGSLQEVARFVAEKLSTLGGVLSTVTHFQLKIYKQNGFLSTPAPDGLRLPITP